MEFSSMRVLCTYFYYKDLAVKSFNHEAIARLRENWSVLFLSYVVLNMGNFKVILPLANNEQ